MVFSEVENLNSGPARTSSCSQNWAHNEMSHTASVSCRLWPFLFLLWSDVFVCEASQSTSMSELDMVGSSSSSFPDVGTVQSFADFGTHSAPPPPYDATNDLESPVDGRSPNGLEILVAIFFFVAAAWLLVAVF